MSKSEKNFDSVAMMRTARDLISTQIEGMSLEEELKWLASQELRDPFLKRLRDRVAQRGNARDASSPTPNSSRRGARK